MPKAFRRKPLVAFQREAAEQELEKQYGFWSLMSIGVGGSVGSGVLVLAGEIAATKAGAATFVSFLIGGLVCALTALAYAELAAKLVSTGSTYSFAYFGLGEGPALVAAWLVTLEYAVSGAAVARSWGDKLAYWLSSNDWVECDTGSTDCWVNALDGTSFNPGAGLICVVIAGILLCGAKVQRDAVNFLVGVKVALILFILVAGACFVDPANLSPVVPPAGDDTKGGVGGGTVGGVSGILLGATSGFFGFVGFDEATCLAGEATRPQKDIPRALMGTIVVVTMLYVVAAVVLTGMMPYAEIDQVEGFGSAFVYNGADWAMQVVVVGELLVVLPTVILVSVLPQSRILYAVSRDGQLPRSVFGNPNLFLGTVVSCVAVTLLALFVPFQQLNDLISGGILLAFIITNMALLLTRGSTFSGNESKHEQASFALVAAVLAMTTFMCATCFVLNKSDAPYLAVAFGALSVLLLVFLLFKFDFSSNDNTFKVPLVPVTPAVAIFVNWYLFSQLSWLGVGEVVLFVLLAALTDLLHGFHHAVDYTTTPQWPSEAHSEAHSKSSTAIPVAEEVVHL